MTIVRNPTTKTYEADVRDRVIRRLHVSLGTKKRAEAEQLHAAVVQLVREGDAELVDLLRHRKVNVEAVARCVREKRPFASLRPSLAWPTVAEAVEEYVAWLEAHPEKATATAVGARYQLLSFAERFADAPLDGVRRADAEAWQAALLGAVAVNTARVTVGRVVSLYAWHRRREEAAAAEARRAPRPLASPLDPETRPTRTTKRERFLSHEDAERVVAATPEALLCPVALGILAGLRIREALYLRPGIDVDLDRDMLVIQERGTKGEPGHWRPKSGKRREIPITSDLRPILERQLALAASDAYLIPSAADPRRPMPPNTLRVHFARVVARAGLVAGRRHAAGVVYHTLRHTFASWLVMKDVNPYRIAKLLGNSLAMVETTYGHLAPKDNRAAVELLSGAVRLPTFDPPTDEEVA